MTIDTTQALDILKTRLHGVSEVEEGIFRGERRHGNRPFAVFYVDLTDKIKERADTLSGYQDRVLGSHYFDSSDDLRWNSYLLLLAEKEQFQDASFRSARSVLEGDRNYARKLVIPPEDLEHRITAQLIVPTPTQGHFSGIVERWEKILVPVGLEAVFADGEIAPLVRSLADESPSKPVSKIQQSNSTKSGDLTKSFLAQLRLKSYRRYPVGPTFDFGAVNLVCGANGVGKTSLLEAIEYFYTGGNRRCRPPPSARISAILQGDTVEREMSKQVSEQSLRERQLAWYGRLSLRGNHLPESFGTYNFLNTDAAVHLSMGDEDQLSREKDLATLLVGSEASRIWGRIERVREGVRAEVRGLTRQMDEMVERRKAQQSRLSLAESTPRQSDELFAQLRSALEHAGWRSALSVDKAVAANDPHLQVQQLWTSLRVSLGLSDLPSEPTVQTLQATLAIGHAWLARVEAMQAEAAKLAPRMKDAETTEQALNARLIAIQRYQAFWVAGYPAASAHFESQNSSLKRVVQEVQGFDANRVFALELTFDSLPLKNLLANARQREMLAANAAETARQLFHAFKAEHTKAESLAQELRAIARQILDRQAQPDTCPLCHSQFELGQLAAHMHRGLADGQVGREDELSKAVSVAQSEQETARSLSNQLQELEQFCLRAAIPLETPLEDILRNLGASIQRLETLRSECQLADVRLSSLAKSGFTQPEYQELQEKLGSDFQTVQSIDDLSELVAPAEMQLEQARINLQECRSDVNRLLEQRNTLASEAGLEEGLKLSVLRERLTGRMANPQSALDAVFTLRPFMVVDETTRLPDVLSVLEVAASAHERLKLAISSEASADSTLADARKALDLVDQQKQRLTGALARYTAAESALDEVIELHSLEIATREALHRNRFEVSTIFERIHSPQEFEVSASNTALLQRRETKEPIELNKISSGQRGAFALSLFLALNAKAVKAPPVMLIDDPVAHVDDLNTLSFLDYLRDLAAAKDRQIFFATADEKLASLFSRKFSFLSSDFKRLDLKRQ